jgi:hypothetical protein
MDFSFALLDLHSTTWRCMAAVAAIALSITKYEKRSTRIVNERK